MPSVLIIACGALAREIGAVIAANRWSHVKVQCLPANLHNRPEKIPAAVLAAVQAAQGRYRQVLVAYADCGTGGLLDAALAGTGAERLPGAHCYAFYAGEDVFAAMADAEPGTFYLTDFLTRHFERLVMRELGIDARPELAPVYFGNYRRVVYLAQSEDAALLEQARAAARRLGLPLEYRHTGYGQLGAVITRFGGTRSGRTIPIQASKEPASWPN